MNHMSLRYSFFAIVPDGIIEIPQGSNLSWLTLFYALPRELVEKYPPTLSLPRNIYELLDDPASMEVIKNDMFLLLVWDCFACSARDILFRVSSIRASAECNIRQTKKWFADCKPFFVY